MDRDTHARDDAVRTALDAIRDPKEAGVDDAVVRKLEEVERALGSDPEADPPKKRQPRQAGAFAGRFRIGPEFFEPLSDEELRAWGED